MNWTRTHIALLVLIVFYMVGIVGLSMESTRPLLAQLSSLNLLLTLLAFQWANGANTRSMLGAFVFIYLFGFFVELLGVHTGILFGNYKYGANLGLKLWGIPVIIGVNWFILSVSTYEISNRLPENRVLRAILAALAMTLLDIIIEPVAIALEFWTWEHAQVPVQNYGMWFVTSLIIQAALQFLRPKVDIRLAIGLFVIQILFFGILNMTLVV